ncbi:hypothetical protein BS50DRAFT_658199 [Corynespora cassiicola Philippines]|uniref:Uncharacterized protein n=1 Tax=Corynespora cassiicola Philippines TaxID=1448308 RepID=A0A2T2P483_CORCC|nr:hypothetical protein BS50DRAFT_658199 [Corynespora cassiicola Philippines]
MAKLCMNKSEASRALRDRFDGMCQVNQESVVARMFMQWMVAIQWLPSRRSPARGDRAAEEGNGGGGNGRNLRRKNCVAAGYMRWNGIVACASHIAMGDRGLVTGGYDIALHRPTAAVQRRRGAGMGREEPDKGGLRVRHASRKKGLRRRWRRDRQRAGEAIWLGGYRDVLRRGEQWSTWSSASRGRASWSGGWFSVGW